jgi:hypothetical protein
MSRPQHLNAPRRSHEDFENALLASSSTQHVSSSDPDRLVSLVPAEPRRSRQGSSFGTPLEGISESTSNTEGGPSHESFQAPSRTERSGSGGSGIFRGIRDDDKQRNARSVSNAANKGPSMGIDGKFQIYYLQRASENAEPTSLLAELAPSERAQIAKRRSIFRSAGTASTPDLTNRAKNGQQAANGSSLGPSQSSHLSPEREEVEYLSSPSGPRSPPLPVDARPMNGTVRDRSASHAPSMVQSSSNQTNNATQRSATTVSSRSSGLQSPKAGTVSSRPSVSHEDSFKVSLSMTMSEFS